MESLIKATKSQDFPVSILVVLTDNESAPGIQLAKNHYVPVKIFDKKKFSRSEFETNSQKILLNYKIELICLAGFMQILSKKFVYSWQNRIINIHPSYLPKNKGLNPQKQVINEKASYTGCTVHFVDEGVDSGPIIVQEVIKINANDTEATLSNRILLKEHKAYPKAVKLIADKKIKIMGRKVKILS